jgi:hypothetical protein
MTARSTGHEDYMSTTTKSRKPRTKLPIRVEAENFGHRLLMGHPKYLFITRETKTGGLKVTLAKAHQHVEVETLKNKIQQEHPNVVILPPSDPLAVTFQTPGHYGFNEVYELLHSAAH